MTTSERRYGLSELHTSTAFSQLQTYTSRYATLAVLLGSLVAVSPAGGVVSVRQHAADLRICQKHRSETRLAARACDETQTSPVTSSFFSFTALAVTSLQLYHEP